MLDSPNVRCNRFRTLVAHSLYAPDGTLKCVVPAAGVLALRTTSAFASSSAKRRIMIGSRRIVRSAMPDRQLTILLQPAFGGQVVRPQQSGASKSTATDC